MHYNDLEDKYDSYPFSLLEILRQTQISFNTISGNLWQEWTYSFRRHAQRES